MKRKLLTRTADDQQARTRAYMRIARLEGENPLWRKLHRAPRLEKPQPLREALRIARGHTV